MPQQLMDFWAWLNLGGSGSFSDFYATSLRSDLFSGLLTLCAFLFSLKTFLLVTLEKDVYSTDAYGERIARLSQNNKKLTRYGQLGRLNRTLFWAVLLTFLAAIMQLTVGLVPKNWAAATAVTVAVIGILVVGYNLFVQRVVLSDWLQFLEEKSKNPPPDVQ